LICFLRHQIHLAAVGDDLVFLDVGRGAYACAPGLAGDVRLERAQGWLEIGRAEVAEALKGAGFITDRAPAATTSSAPPPRLPTTSVWRAAQPRAAAADHRRMACAYSLVVRRYYRRSFASVIAFAGAGARGEPSGPTADLSRGAQVFDQLLAFTPFQGECLFRSFMLLMFLRLGGQNARWVLGVQTYPFQAHCWLQAGGAVLDDAAERIGGFTPIFAV
jgi:hypothetical protein